MRDAIQNGIWRIRHIASTSYYHLAGLGPALLESLGGARAERLIILDDCFPLLLTGFRIAEFNALLTAFDQALVYSTCRSRRAYSEYAAVYPQFVRRIRRIHSLSKLRASGAYIVFLSNAFNFIDRLEQAKTPFIFEMYPGGHFGIDRRMTDEWLQRIVQSPQFRKVVTTQSITRDYLIRKGFCQKEQIEFIYGGVLPSELMVNGSAVHRRYGIDKRTVDICFVANKYIPQGLDKGYDRFVECAFLLSERYPGAHFHVVGNFDATDVDVSKLSGRISFYGTRTADFFPAFYSGMDLIISPNVPFMLYPGQFDGFPTGCCVEAGLCGTALLITDELRMNEGRLKEGEECVIISREPEQIAAVVGQYIEDPLRLAKLGENSQRAMRRLFSIEAQMAPRIQLLRALINSES